MSGSNLFVSLGRSPRSLQEDGGAGGGPGAVVVCRVVGLERQPEADALRDQRPPQASADQWRQQQQRRQQEQWAAQSQNWE